MARIGKDCQLKKLTVAITFSQREGALNKLVAVGIVALVGCATSAFGQTSARPVYIVYDMSNSMWAATPNAAPKYELASASLQRLKHLNMTGREVLVRVFGVDKTKQCTDSRLLGRARSSQELVQLTDEVARTLPAGKSALAFSLREAARDLQGAPADVVIYSDGAEGADQCPGDPCELARTWKEAGSGLAVHVVDFGQGVSAPLSCIAAAQGTQIIAGDRIEAFFQARTPAESSNVAAIPKGENLLEAVRRIFWRKLSQAQASVLAAIITSVFTLGGAVIAFFILRGQIKDVKRTLDETQSRFEALLGTMKEQIVELHQSTDKIGDKVTGMGKQVADIAKTVKEVSGEEGAG